MHKIILYGAGKRCEALFEILQKSNIKIEAIIDSDINKWGKNLGKYKICSPEKIQEFQDINICITVADNKIINEIRENLYQLYPNIVEKEISYLELILNAYKEKLNILDKSKSEKLNILFDSYNGLGLGGVEAWTMNLCESLINEGKNDIYIISNKGDYNIACLMKKHIIYVDVDLDKKFSEKNILNLVKVIKAKMPCKVVTSTINDVLLAASLMKICYPDSIQIISVIHNSIKWMYDEYLKFKNFIDIYIGVSQDIRNDMILQGIEPEKIFTMTCPFVCEKNLLRTYTYNKFLPLHIGYAGRMDGMQYSQKRMDLILKLIEVLTEKKIYFVMELAGDGPARTEMEKYVVLHHLSEYVKFLGIVRREKIPSFWKRQDICINLADYEGRSISIVEAMGNGAVPIVTNTSGVKEDIIDGINGFIVSLGDYFKVAEKIEYLDKNREKLKEMGKLAHKAVYPKSLMKPHLRFWNQILFESN